MFNRLFLDHPRDVGESYAEHFATAAGFGVRMVGGGLACIVHAVVPVLFVRTASDTVKSLYATMKARQRRRQMPDGPEADPIAPVSPAVPAASARPDLPPAVRRRRLALAGRARNPSAG